MVRTFSYLTLWNRAQQSVMLGLLVFLLVVLSNSGCTSTDSPQAPPDADCRMVQHLKGETCVPNNPQRLVVLGGLDYVLSLDLKPMGSDAIYRTGLYAEDKVNGIEKIGDADAPSLERILALKPDFILGMDYVSADYEILSNIAPTVIFPFEHSGEWKDSFMLYAEALDKTAQAEQVMSRYYQRLEDFQQQMGDRLDEIEISVVRAYPTHVNLYLKDSFCGAIIADAGLSRPPSQNFTASEAKARFRNSIQYEISREQIPGADGDAIFLVTYGHKEEIARQARTAKEKLKEDPLWSTLTAVQRDRVYEVTGYWLGEGPIAANLVIDDLFKYLVESDRS